MPRDYSLAYLTAHRCTPPEAVRIAADSGYGWVGLRPWPNAPGLPHQPLLQDPELLRETQAALRDTGVRVFDLELIRIGETFDPHIWDRLYDTAASLGALAILVAGDQTDASRLAANYAELCEAMAPYGLTADLEFMPWTAVPDAATALRVLEAAGDPANAGILVDALHFGRSRTSLDDIRKIPRKWLHYAQICDAAAGLDFTTEQLIHTARCDRLPPGEGSIDVQGLFAALPHDLPVCVEVVNLEREATTSPQEWAAECLMAARKVLGET
jgi:Sugar phosphate isomerases/epimerases